MKCTYAKRLPLLGALLAFVLLTGWTVFDLFSAHVTAPPPADHLAEASAKDEVAAPDFTLTTLEGESFRLADQRGKVVVLNFWATWCPPCREEIPDFIAMQDHFGSDEVVFAGISLDQTGPDAVAAFAEEMGVNYPIMIDDGAAERAYGPVSVMPTTFVIDRDGMVKGYAPGMVTRDMLEPILADLVAQTASR